ncbi:MAG: hypothetical protein Q8R13_01420 [bacterium]|nr:hypothetical protein [bacterium]
MNLGKYNVYLKLMIDGVASKAFSATTLPPYPKPQESFREKIIRVSRERYSTKRALVEEKIMRWYGLLKDDGEAGAPAPGRQLAAGTAERRDLLPGGIRRDDKGAPQLFETVCAHCRKKAWVPFKPDGVRPVYCDECLAKIRSGELVVPPRGPAPRAAAGADEPASAAVAGARTPAVGRTPASASRYRNTREAAGAPSGERVLRPEPATIRGAHGVARESRAVGADPDRERSVAGGDGAGNLKHEGPSSRAEAQEEASAERKPRAEVQENRRFPGDEGPPKDEDFWRANPGGVSAERLRMH